VLELWRRLNKKEGWPEVFNELHASLATLLGPERGMDNFNYILGMNGVDSWQHFKSMQKARNCVLVLYRKIQEVASQSQEPNHPDITDADVPMGDLFPGEAA
jgi:hypothetical protein